MSLRVWTGWGKNWISAGLTDLLTFLSCLSFKCIRMHAKKQASDKYIAIYRFWVTIEASTALLMQETSSAFVLDFDKCWQGTGVGHGTKYTERWCTPVPHTDNWSRYHAASCSSAQSPCKKKKEKNRLHFAFAQFIKSYMPRLETTEVLHSGGRYVSLKHE